MLDQMPDPVRPHDRQRRIEAALHERRRLVERAGLQHRVESGVDAPVEGIAIGREEEARPFAGPQRRRGARALERGERPAGRGEHLERSQDPLAVRGPQTGRRLRIERASSACRSAVARPSALARIAARTASGTAGTSDRPSVRARK